MGRGDDYASFEGDDDVGAASFGGESSGGGMQQSAAALARADSGGRRKHSRGGMGAKGGHSNSHHSKSHGISRGFGGFDLGSVREAAGSMIAVAVIGVVICAIILYFTFIDAMLPQFYGALGAAMVVVALLCFVTARLLGVEG